MGISRQAIAIQHPARDCLAPMGRYSAEAVTAVGSLAEPVHGVARTVQGHRESVGLQRVASGEESLATGCCCGPRRMVSAKGQ